MNRTFHPVDGQRERSGASRGYTFTGWEYQDGWLINFRANNLITETSLWICGSFESPSFYLAPSIPNPGMDLLDADPIEITLSEKNLILDMLWEWEVWEPVTAAGTCAIESLERMLDLPRETLLDWFRSTGRNPSVPEDILQVLTERNYLVECVGPEGFGRFRDFRRLVTMFRKNDPSSGHVVLIYEDDRDIFDASGVFRKVSDIIFSGMLGYDRGPVWRINKAEAQ